MRSYLINRVFILSSCEELVHQCIVPKWILIDYEHKVRHTWYLLKNMSICARVLYERFSLKVRRNQVRPILCAWKDLNEIYGASFLLHVSYWSDKLYFTGLMSKCKHDPFLCQVVTYIINSAAPASIINYSHYLHNVNHIICFFYLLVFISTSK